MSGGSFISGKMAYRRLFIRRLIVARLFDVRSSDWAMRMASQMVDAENDGQNAEKDHRIVHYNGM